MKYFILLAIAVLTFLQSRMFAQEQDTLRYFKGKMKVITREKEKGREYESVSLKTGRDSIRTRLETSWITFDIGFNNYIDRSDYPTTQNLTTNSVNAFAEMTPAAQSGDFELRSGKSIHINLGIVKQQLSLYKHYVNLVFGLTYDINNWSFQNPITWKRENVSVNSLAGPQVLDNTNGSKVIRDSVAFRKNKLVTNYLQVPVLIRFETSPHHASRNVYCSFGGYVGYLVRSHTKQVVSGTSDKRKTFDDFNLNKFQYGAQAELGYQGFSVYFKRSFSALTSFGTVQYPFAFGVRLSGL